VCDYTTGYLAALGAGAALLRRAREGGSYAVEARMCQTATWVGGLPLVDASAAPPFDPSGLPSTATVTDWGPLQHLSPVAQLSATPGRYAVPPPRLGAHPPRF
jgi:crotonobetainyl-CoA:carnitine CoA-transferase CaiB-like acyl-CoA transferase